VRAQVVELTKIWFARCRRDQEVDVGVRDNRWGTAASELKPGERIEIVTFVQAVGPYWVLATWLIVVIAHAYRVVVVTDQRILVCQGGSFSYSAIKGVLREFPRQTEIGPQRAPGIAPTPLARRSGYRSSSTRTSPTPTAHRASICAAST
jgi:hypothetical protein